MFHLGKHEEGCRIPFEVVDLKDSFWVWQIKLLQVAVQACAWCSEVWDASTDTQTCSTHAHYPLDFTCSSVGVIMHDMLCNMCNLCILGITITIMQTSSVQVQAVQVYAVHMQATGQNLYIATGVQ